MSEPTERGPSGKRYASTPVRGLTVARERVMHLTMPRIVVLVAVFVVGISVAARWLRDIPAGSANVVATLSVRDLLNARDAGVIAGETIRVSGYWWNRIAPLSCPAPTGIPGDLELYCVEGMFGITDARTPLDGLDPDVNGVRAFGTYISPWVPREATEIWGQLADPDRASGVPITVAAHFDDPRAEECRSEYVEECRDRLVIDRLVSIGSGAVATRAPDPKAPDLPPPFMADSCAGDDVGYSFVGWITTNDLQLEFDRPGYVYAMVTTDVVLLGGESWNADPAGSSNTFRVWGRMICIGQPGVQGLIEHSSVAGHSFVEWSDGLRVAGEVPVR